MDTKVTHAAARLPSLGTLSCTGDEARSFLHAQLTSDVLSLTPGGARLAGWCSAKGRLLATFLVVPRDGEILLQLPRALAPAVARRLSMFILRAKARLSDASDAWQQTGVWGAGAAARLAALGLAVPEGPLQVAQAGGCITVKVAPQRFLVFLPAAGRERAEGLAPQADENAWALEEIRAGRPLVLPETQEHFVPQMVNLERLGAVDFHKGCYPGQEVVARTQYRGVLKRRMVRARVAAAAAAGDELFGDEISGQASGAVVNAAAAPEGGSELLAVVQINVVEGGRPIRLRAPDGPPLELLPLPYA
jgi:tRNA-modifying protein YgfZ